MELIVEVVHLCISLPDRLPNRILNTLGLEPGLSVREIVTRLNRGPRDVIVRSHEGIEHAQLVELNE